jgi:hypothetical protein
MLTIIPERPLQESMAQEIADALRDDGCDVWVDTGYGNAINIRAQTGGKFVLYIHERDYQRGIVTLLNRWENTYMDIRKRTFINDWRDYMD